MSEIIRMVAVLSIIAGVCSAALTSAHHLLTPAVDRQTDFYVRGPALENLFGRPADEVLGNKILVAGETTDVPVFFVKTDDQVSTLAVEAVARGGYGGDLILMVGVDLLQEKLTGMEAVAHSETPGLGARIEEPGFRRQWQGLGIDKPVALTRDGGTIDAISGASTTARAAVNGTNDVLDFVRNNKDEILRQIAEL